MSQGTALHQQFLAAHPQRPIQLRCGVDRYGFSHLLAARLGLPRAPRSFANWLHGWIWWDADCARDLMFDAAIRAKTHVVATPAQRAMLLAEGFADVRVGGLPFAYTQRSAQRRRPGWLLAMPPHSSERDKLARSLAGYLDWVGSLRADFEQVAVCVFHADFTPEVEADLRRRGLAWVPGARPDDANALPRMRAIFDAFEFMTTSAMGSHVAYAAFAGCRTSLAGPLYRYGPDDFAATHDAAYVDKLVAVYSEDQLRRDYPALFAATPAAAAEATAFGRRALGSEATLGRDAILDALSWRALPQLAGYLAAARGRLARRLA